MKTAILMSLASPWSRKTATALAESGHEIHVIDFDTTRRGRGTVKTNDAFQLSAIQAFGKTVKEIHILQTRYSSSLRYFTSVPALRKLLKQIEPDVLLTLYGGGFANLALFSGFHPYAVYAVGSDVLLSKGIARRLGRAALSRASLVFANGQFLAGKTRELSPSANVECLLLGVDTHGFPPPAIPPGRKTIFFNNRGFAPVYNNEYIIQALSLLKPPLPDFHFHFASLGPGLESVKQLAARILTPEMQAQLTFWGGVDQTRMLELLHQSHYFVSVSRSDGTATSLLEAMSCGLFPILSDIPQNRDWVDSNQKNGVLVPLDQPEVLAKILANAIHHPEESTSKAAANRELVCANADSSKTMQILAARLKSLA